MVTVPKPTPAATIWLIKWDELNSQVRMDRSLEYPSSPISDDPATIQKGIPNASRLRATMYIPSIIVNKPRRVKTWEGAFTSVKKALNQGTHQTEHLGIQASQAEAARQAAPGTKAPRHPGT